MPAQPVAAAVAGRLGEAPPRAAIEAAAAQALSEPRPLRVCLVNLGAYAALAPDVEAAIGGEEVQHAALARLLARQPGVAVSLVTCDFGQADGACIDGVTVRCCYRPDAGLPVLRFIAPRWFGLHAALGRADADVYYVSCAGALLGQVAWYASMHGRGLVFRAASDGDCDPARLLVGGRKEALLYRCGLRRADALSVQTQVQQGLMRRHFGRDSVVLPMVFDPPAQFEPAGERDLDVLWVANLRALKQPERLIELARRLPGRRIHMVGGAVAGEPEVARRVAAAAQGLPQLTWHGRLGYARTLALFDRARVFVNTSRIEGFPNTFLQAWSRGVPTVSFFDPDGTIAAEGLGAAVSDDHGLEHAVRSLLDEPLRRAAASSRCLRYMARAHPAGGTAGSYLSLLRAAAAARMR